MKSFKAEVERLCVDSEKRVAQPHDKAIALYSLCNAYEGAIARAYNVVVRGRLHLVAPWHVGRAVLEMKTCARNAERVVQLFGDDYFHPACVAAKTAIENHPTELAKAARFLQRSLP